MKTNQPIQNTDQQIKLSLLKIQVRAELPAGTIGYADFLTLENFNTDYGPEITKNINLLRLEELRPGTLAEFCAIIMGI